MPSEVIVFSTEIDVQVTNSDIYAWSTEEELSPQGYVQNAFPAASVKEAVCFPWSPGNVAPLNGDALYLAGVKGPGNFGIRPVYITDTHGTVTTNVEMSGASPINSLNSEMGRPYVTAIASYTGGTIPSGKYAVGVSAFDGSGGSIYYLDLAYVTVPGGQSVSSTPTSVCSNGSLTISGAGGGYMLGDYLSLAGAPGVTVVVTGTTGGYSTPGSITLISLGDPGHDCSTGTFSASGGHGSGASFTITALNALTSTGSIAVTIEWGPGDSGGDIYVASSSISAPELATLISKGQGLAQNQFHWQQTLSPGQTTATITSFDASTSGGPDTLFHHFAVSWQQVAHTGPWAEQVQVVTGTVGASPGKVTIAGPGMTTNQWAGYTLTLLAHYDSALPVEILNMPIASSTASTGGGNPTFTLTIGQNSVSGQLPSLTGHISIGDLVGVLFKPTFTANSFTDANIANGYYPTGDTGIEKGHLAVMMTGVNAGDVQTVSSVSGVNNITVNISGKWQVTPATGDVVMICLPAAVPEWKGRALSTPNRTGGSAVIATPNIQNLLSTVWMFTVRTEDSANNTAPDFCHPKRVMYFFGAQGTRLITAAGSPWTQIRYDGLVDADCSAGNVVYNCVAGVYVPNQEFTVNVVAISGSYTTTVNMASGWTFADGSTSWVGSVLGASITFKASAA